MPSVSEDEQIAWRKRHHVGAYHGHLITNHAGAQEARSECGLALDRRAGVFLDVAYSQPGKGFFQRVQDGERYATPRVW